MPKLKKYSEIYDDEDTHISNYRASNDFLLLKNIQEKLQNKDDSNDKIMQISMSPQKLKSNKKDKKKRESTKKKQAQPKIKSKNQRISRADEILKEIQQQYRESSDKQSQPLQKQQLTNDYLPEEYLFDFNGNKNEKKRRNTSNKAKIKNKFFDLQVKDDSRQGFQQGLSKNMLETQQLEINMIGKKISQEEIQKRNLNWKQRLEDRANKLKDRLQFKNAIEDPRYKEDIQKKLKDVKDCQEVNVVIEMPKIFKGNNARHADAALYLKNTAKSFQKHNSQSNMKLDKKINESNDDSNTNQNKKEKIDRKTFFSQFDKEIREEKCQNIGQKQLFKKTSLDQIAIDFQKNEHLFRQRRNSHQEFSQKQNRHRRSKNSQKSEHSSSRNNSIDRLSSTGCKMKKSSPLNMKIASQKQINNNQSKKIFETVKQQFKQTSQSLQNLHQKHQNRQIDQKNQKNKKNEKQKKSKPKSVKKKKDEKQKKINKKIIEGFFENEAEDSQNGYGDDGYSTGSDANYNQSQFDDLINKNCEVQYVKTNEKKARRKYFENLAEDEEREMNRIKQMIARPYKIKCEESSQSRRKRKIRMQEKRKRFEEQDGENIDLIDFKIDRQEHEKQESQQQDKQQFKHQLQSLEMEICANKQETKKNTDKKQVVHKVYKNNWKNVKSVIRQKKSDKRGGFISKEIGIIGNKISTVPKRRSSNKKQINFQQ